MTREEAIEFGNKWLQINEDSKNSHTYKFIKMAIKAIEQEPILDKIRSEIESITPKAHIRTGKLSIDTELMIPLYRVLKVLDKYKVEQEET